MWYVSKLRVSLRKARNYAKSAAESTREKDKFATHGILIKRKFDFLTYGFALLNMFVGNHIQLTWGGGVSFTGTPPFIKKINEAAQKAREEKRRIN